IVDGLAEPLALAGGDLALCQPGLGHSLVDRPETELRVPAASLGDGSRSCVSVYGPGDGARTTFICGAFELPAGPTHSLLGFLPPVLHIGGGGGQPATDGFQAIIGLLSAEAASGRAGSDIIARRL